MKVIRQILTLLLLANIAQIECFSVKQTIVGAHHARYLSVKTAGPSGFVRNDGRHELHPKVTTTALQSAAGESESPLPVTNLAFGLVWAAIVSYVVFLAPGGEAADMADNTIVQAFQDNFVDPDINKLYLFVFNLFLVVTWNLASVILPQAPKEGAPAAPFVLASVFAGYFAIGPYLSIRGETKETVTASELNWFTRNVLENTILNWAMFALIPFFFARFVLPAATVDAQGLLDGFFSLVHTSRFAAASTTDFFTLHFATAFLIKRDYELRASPDNAEKAATIAAAAALFPVVGGALYCALRPKLQDY